MSGPKTGGEAIGEEKTKKEEPLEEGFVRPESRRGGSCGIKGKNQGRKPRLTGGKKPNLDPTKEGKRKAGKGPE